MTKARENSDYTGLQGDLALKSPVASPVFTGNVGINNSSPTQRLETNGNAQFNMYDDPSGAGGYYTTKGLQIGNAFDAGLSGGDDDRNAIVWNERGTSLLFGTTNLERMRIDSAGHAIIGGGVTLGNGQTYAAANTLDDYEEGTWTATATNVAATISNTTYTKIGRVVYVTGHLVCTATATGDVTINGLPYVQKPSSNGIGTCMNYLVNVAGGSTYNFSTYLSGSGLRFYRSEDNSAWLWAGASSLYNGAQILFNLTYQTT